MGVIGSGISGEDMDHGEYYTTTGWVGWLPLQHMWSYGCTLGPCPWRPYLYAEFQERWTQIWNQRLNWRQEWGTPPSKYIQGTEGGTRKASPQEDWYHKITHCVRYERIYLCGVVTLVMDLSSARKSCWWQVLTKCFIFRFSFKSETLLRVLVINSPISAELAQARSKYFVLGLTRSYSE